MAEDLPIFYYVNKAKARLTLGVMIFPALPILYYFFTFEPFSPEWGVIVLGALVLIGFGAHNVMRLRSKDPVISILDDGVILQGYPLIPWDNIAEVTSKRMSDYNPTTKDPNALVITLKDPDAYFAHVKGGNRMRRGAWMIGGHIYVDETDFEYNAVVAAVDIKRFNPHWSKD